MGGRGSSQSHGSVPETELGKGSSATDVVGYWIIIISHRFGLIRIYCAWSLSVTGDSEHSTDVIRVCTNVSVSSKKRRSQKRDAHLNPGLETCSLSFTLKCRKSYT